MTRLLYLIFFASGATGLVYEVIWVRLTGLVFGNTSFSIATVLGAFMTGLALGSWLLGAMADRYDRPLRVYGVLEILIGISALLVPIAFRSMQEVYWSLAPTLSSLWGADVFLPFIVSFAIMVVPTFLMGGTLPVLSRFFVRRTNEVEAKLGRLYAPEHFRCGTGYAGRGTDIDSRIWKPNHDDMGRVPQRRTGLAGNTDRPGSRGATNRRGRTGKRSRCRIWEFACEGQTDSADADGVRICCTDLRGRVDTCALGNDREFDLRVCHHARHFSGWNRSWKCMGKPLSPVGEYSNAWAFPAWHRVWKLGVSRGVSVGPLPAGFPDSGSLLLVSCCFNGPVRLCVRL